MRNEIYYKMLTSSAIVPNQKNYDDAGYDLYADHFHMVVPDEVAVISTGISIAMPEDYVGLIHPRSGLAMNQGITVVNAPGTVDAGYRGEIKVLLTKLTPGTYSINKGDRVAQIIFQKYERPRFVPAQDQELFEYTSARGAGGFGSSGR